MTPNDEVELKECPFCGKSDIEIRLANIDEMAYGEFDSGKKIHYCQCKECSCHYGWGTKEEAIKAWNTRQQSPSSGLRNLNKEIWNKAVSQLEAEIILRKRNHHPGMSQFYNHPEDIIRWSSELLYEKFGTPNQQMPTEELILTAIKEPLPKELHLDHIKNPKSKDYEDGLKEGAKIAVSIFNGALPKSAKAVLAFIERKGK